MNRSDPDFAAYEDWLPILRRHPEHVRRLHPRTREEPPRNGDSLTSVDRYFRTVGTLRARHRAYLQRLARFALHVSAGIDPDAAERLAWLDAPPLQRE